LSADLVTPISLTKSPVIVAADAERAKESSSKPDSNFFIPDPLLIDFTKLEHG